MNEKVYAVLYKVQALDRTDGLFYYQPCHITCGLYDSIDNEFLDEAVNEIRYKLDDRRTIIEQMDYAIGPHYTESELIEVCGGALDLNQALLELYESALETHLFCNYDYNMGIMHFTQHPSTEFMTNTFKQLENYLFNGDAIENSEDSSENDGILYMTEEQANSILAMKKTQDIENYTSYLKTLNEESFLKGLDEENCTSTILFSENHLDELLEQKDVDTLKEELLKLIKMVHESNDKEKEDEEIGDIDELKKELNSLDDIAKELMNKLNSLIGLDNVKKMVDLLISDLIFKKKTEENLVFEDTNKHMVYTGSPGTGKTTVAQLLAPFLYKIGFLKSDKVAFVSAKDLVGEYIGQTAPRTAKVIKNNKGGVIFLDEAYILSGHGREEFGNEAIAEILKEMEKPDGTMFIFAGYEKEMNDFIKMNSGLRSRVGNYISFKDYSEEELYQIFEKTVKDTNKSEDAKYKLHLSEGAIKKVKESIHEAHGIKNFGNARFVKNLFSEIRKYHSKNTRDVNDPEILYLITEQDIPDDILDTLFFNKKDYTDSLYTDSHIGFKVMQKK